MDNRPDPFYTDSNGRFLAPLETAFDRIRTPFEEFVHRTTTAGLLLMSTAVVALLLANSLLANTYLHSLHVPIGLKIGDWLVEKSLHHWINDGLMTLFFFAVGLELKRELLVGELAQPKQALLPILAAIGGMVFPALIYFSINPEGIASQGWGIPMATDIAFALGVIALLASRVPKALIVFLVGLAIVDDLGAVLVIALFYTKTLAWDLILAAALITALMVIMNLSGVRRPLPYFIMGIVLWMALLGSGVHATLAGVITAFAIPALPRYNTRAFSERVRALLDRFDALHDKSGNLLRNQKQFAILQTLENGVKGVATPLQRLEHYMHSPVTFLVLPVFALANAGIPLDSESLFNSLSSPITQGVMVGLILGKVIGISGTSYLAVKLNIARLPDGVNFIQMIGVSLLGSIGFTMSIFITEISFVEHSDMIIQSKTGILLASLLAGIGGYMFLRRVSARGKSA